MRTLEKTLLAALAPVLLAGCVTVHGPTSFTLTRDEIERNIQLDLGRLMEGFRGLDARRPEVAFMPVANRLELAWYFTMPAQGEGGALFGNNVGVAVVMSGRPQLDAGRTGVVLTGLKVDDVRLLGVPNVLAFGAGHLPSGKDMVLPDLPLYNFSPAQLRRADVAYGATAVEVTFRGLRIDIAPR